MVGFLSYISVRDQLQKSPETQSVDDVHDIPSGIESYIASYRAELSEPEKWLSPALTAAGPIDLAADNAHLVAILRQRVTAWLLHTSHSGIPEELREFCALLIGPEITQRSLPPISSEYPFIGRQANCVSTRLTYYTTSSTRPRPDLRLDSTPSPARTYTTLREIVSSPIASWFVRPRNGRERASTVTSSSTSTSLTPVVQELGQDF